MDLRKLDQLELDGKKVLVRLDLNVPLKNGQITDDTRIQAALPTLKYITERTNKIAIMSHLGRPKGQVVEGMSLETVGLRLAELLDRDVVFVRDYTTEPLEQVLNQLDRNQIILLENLRFHEGETKNDRDFSQSLVQGFDYYVNDAFGTLHRAHASVVGVPELLPAEKRAAGFLVQKETRVLSEVQKNPRAPFVAIVGGAKVSDKIGVTLNLLNNCNQLLIGGAMAYTFLKYKGHSVGTSKVEEDKLELVESIYRNAESRRVEILLPIDHRAAPAFDESSPAQIIDGADIPEGLMGLDIGPKTAALYKSKIQQAATVLWNGPMGVFEWEAYSQGTMAVAEACAETKAYTVIGGGDSVAAINKAGVADKVDHVSTGGGASLEFLEGKVLPGVKVLSV
ncbi:phosphoglycerate kinase [Pseudobacteriovorax antillogorgiicola]|nr:phosphoglycerate kinase [Pseudobacteriovorax antillogorgiicola]